MRPVGLQRLRAVLLMHPRVKRQMPLHFDHRRTRVVTQPSFHCVLNSRRSRNEVVNMFLVSFAAHVASTAAHALLLEA